MKKWVAIGLTVALAAGALAGCQNAQTGSETESGAQLTYWMPLHDSVSYSYKNFGETELAKELQKATGIQVEYQHPTKGQEKEQFNLMIASKDLPDIVHQATPGSGFKGGAVQAVRDKIIMPLNEYINEKYTPNLAKLMEEDEKIARGIQLDDKTFYGFPAIVRDPFLLTFTGGIVRQDWLDKLNLPMPETVDEWETALKRFKEELGATAPFTVLGTNYFADAFGTPRGYYYDVNKKEITFGSLEPGYKKYVALMHKWYDMGLLDGEFATQDRTIADAKITNGESGLLFTTVGGGMGKYITAMADVQGVKWAGIPYPVEKKGDRPVYGQKSNQVSPQFFITTMCEHPETAVKFLDYGYSEEGHMLYNFGIEGVSYEMKDGYPTYTKQITDNENGVPMVYEMCKYSASAYGGPFEQDKRYFEQYLNTEEQKEAVTRWMQPEYSNQLPDLLLTKEENESIATALTDISNYYVESEYKFIMGKTPMEEYDSYVSRLREMGIEKVLEVYNAAYKRAMSR